MSDASSQTGTTLFAVLQHPADNEAWTKFVDRYGPKISQWARAKGLQQADAENVTQEVLSRFAKASRTFVYDSSKTGFRAWLRTVTRNVLSDLASDLRRTRGNGDSRMQQFLESIDAPDDLQRELDDEFQRELMDQAIHLVRRRVEPKSWKAFELLLNGRSGKEVADQLSMSIAAVYMAKSRVGRMLADEVRALEPRS